MDNFEWIAGFEDHFGIYHVEFNALEDQPAGTDYPDTWAKEGFAQPICHGVCQWYN